MSTLEQVVVTAGQLFQRQRQIAALGVGEIGYALHVRFRQQQRFERPGGPVGHHRQPVLGVHHRAAAVGQFALHIVQQHRLALCGVILFLQTVFPFRFIGQETVCPHLTMRVRVGAAHRCPFVFKTCTHG